MSNRKLNVQRYGVNGQEISWAGECPWTGAHCFGTEDGGFLMPPDLVPDTSSSDGRVVSGAINGIAFCDDVVAFSSPEEVMLWSREKSDPLRLRKLSRSFPGGAHGITASPQGGFVATLADNGLLFLNVDHNQVVTTSVARHVSESLYFYKIELLVSQPAHELFLCAARRDGLLALIIENRTQKMTGIHHSFGAHDITDVCRLNSPQFPLGAACLSRSHGIFVVPNVLSNDPPFEVRDLGLKGTGYSLIAEKGHLFVLTDEHLVCMPNAVTRIAAHAPLDPALIMPISASEMFLIGAHIVVLADGDAHFIEIADLLGESAGQKSVIPDCKSEQVSISVTRHQPTSNPFAWQDSTVDLTLSDVVNA
jgi:hypothetical protein